MSTTKLPTEKSVRRKLARGGLRLMKRRGGFMVVDADTGAALGGGYPVAYGLTLEQAAGYVDWYRSV